MKKGEIGRRIRSVRQDRKQSLRQVASLAGLSATHISEIERGHTTPTVGALVRIADALECETHFFLENEWLPEISVVRASEATEPTPTVNGDHPKTRLTHGIPGARLDCNRILVRPGSAVPDHFDTGGEMAGYVASGRVEVEAGDEKLVLEEGDSFHFRALLPYKIWNSATEPAELVVISSQPTGAKAK